MPAQYQLRNRVDQSSQERQIQAVAGKAPSHNHADMKVDLELMATPHPVFPNITSEESEYVSATIFDSPSEPGTCTGDCVLPADAVNSARVRPLLSAQHPSRAPVRLVVQSATFGPYRWLDATVKMHLTEHSQLAWKMDCMLCSKQSADCIAFAVACNLS